MSGQISELLMFCYGFKKALVTLFCCSSEKAIVAAGV